MRLHSARVRRSVLISVLVVIVVIAAVVHHTGSRPRRLVAGECPAVRVGSNALDDYADAFVWNGMNYWNLGDSAKSLHIGRQLTTAGCNVSDLTERTGTRIAPGPWPDRTSTGLVPGTPVFTIRGVSDACSLAVRVAGRTKIYVAVDQDTGERKPGC